MTRRDLPGVGHGDTILALLLSAVSNEQNVCCTTDPCAVCTVAMAAQTYLNDLRPDRNTGWWWIEEDKEVIAEIVAMNLSGSDESRTVES